VNPVAAPHETAAPAAAPSRLGAVELARLAGLPHAPTPEQVEVVEAPLRPLLVIAGAGSGKTETMAARVVWLVQNELVRPEEVLGLTFTRKAAGELADRIGTRLRALRRGRPAAARGLGEDRPHIATYNAYAGGLVRDNALRIGVDPDAQLLTEAGRWQLAARVVESWAGDLATDAAPSTVVAAVLDLAGALAEHLLTPSEAATQIERLADLLVEKDPATSGTNRSLPRPDVRRTIASLRARAGLMAVVEAFGRRKQDIGVLDFADQVALACRIAREVPDVRAGERARYRVVLLDEYQDTSVAQVALLSALFGDGHPVTAVGDPHQAIYGWRGASAGSVEAFPSTFCGADGLPASVATLSTSWRNDHAILKAANTLAGPLRALARHRARVPLPELAARPGASAGRVLACYGQTAAQEAARVAEVVGGLRRSVDGPPATAAVLCRARAQMPAVAEAFRARGIPVEVVGLGGLLSAPEIADLHAALLAAHDPSRADAAMRLLTGLRLGVADLAVLHDRARDLASPAGGAAAARYTEPASIVEAMERPPHPGWIGRSGRAMSPEGIARVRELGAVLRAIRAQTHLPLPELISTAERLLGLDIEVLAQVGADPRHARRHLDEFTEVAAGFSDGSGEPTLGAFLAWLEAAAEHERGLDTVEVEVDPCAVQVLTVHAAKGLEWDVVAVVGWSDGTFPSYDGPVREAPGSSAWLTSLGALPYPLREDAGDLPELDVMGPSDHTEMAAEWAAFRQRAGEHVLAEERRLAYVAVTRARRALLLTGSWWKEQAKQPRPPSRFLGQLRRAGALEVLGAQSWENPEAAENPLTAHASAVAWPARPEPGRAAALRRSVAAVDEARRQVEAGEWAFLLGTGAGSGPAPTPALEPSQVLSSPGARPQAGRAESARAMAWVRDARLLLAEREEASRPDRDVALPAHLSASSVVRLVADPAAFALERRRPVPLEPTAGARRGTQFHAWVERHFAAATLLGVEDLLGADDAVVEPDPELEALQRTFLASPWAARTPVAVEVSLETPVGGTMVRCRVDAVFATSGGVEIIDWKTGAPPRSGADSHARQVQLALYRLAWARLHDLPLTSVRAAFYHVAQDRLVPADDLDEAAIIAAITERLADGGPLEGISVARQG
jgi:DNA helicase-2/ATP-dependent DNA helicase PcrA